MANTRILIIGSAGYIGSHLVHMLKKDVHYDIIEFDLVYTQDCRELDHLRKIFQEQQIHIVINLAAYIQVGEGETLCAEYYRNNTSTLINILQCMHEYSCTRLIFASTAAVYAVDTALTSTSLIGLSETSPINPESIYGHTKLLAEQLIQQVAPKYHINYTIFRFFNVAGTNDELQRVDRNPHLLPALMTAQRSKQIFKVFGQDYATPDGTCVRDYVHVDDICSAIQVSLLNSSTYQEIFNLGTHKGYSVLEVITTFNAILLEQGFPPLSYEVVERRPGDCGQLVTNIGKARTMLGWRPKFGLYEMITSTLKYT